MSERIYLGEGPVSKGYKYVGYEQEGKLYVELVEAYGAEWAVDELLVENMTEMKEYIVINNN